MINMNLPQELNNKTPSSLSLISRMPTFSSTNILLADLDWYFDKIEKEFDIVIGSASAVETLTPAEHYITLHGINRIAQEAYCASVESFGITFDPGSYPTTLKGISDHINTAKQKITSSLENIAQDLGSCDVVDRWDSVIGSLNKRANTAHDVVKKATFKLNQDKKIVGVTPTTFTHQARQVVVLSAMFNIKNPLNIDVDYDDRVKRAISSLENIEYSCDKVLNLSWTTDDVKMLDDYVQHYLVPNTLKFARLAAKLKQGCYDVINNYSYSRCENFKSLCFAARRTAEVTARLLTCYTDLVK